MKIGQLTGNQMIPPGAEDSKDKVKKSSDSFGSFLSQELNAAVSESGDGPAGLGGAAASVGPIAEASPAWAIGQVALNPAELDGIVRSAGDQLDGISGDIAEGKVSLKQIDGMIRSLSSAADQLQEGLSGLPESHPLRKAGDELSVLSYVESVKWKRGDYL